MLPNADTIPLLMIPLPPMPAPAVSPPPPPPPLPQEISRKTAEKQQTVRI
jgi:hypothetical protein